jgi:hypothetical protein
MEKNLIFKTLWSPSPNLKKEKLTPKTYPFNLLLILRPLYVFKRCSHNVFVKHSQQSEIYTKVSLQKTTIEEGLMWRA